MLCHAVLCSVQDFNPLVSVGSQQQSLSPQPGSANLPHSQWASTEGRRQLHDYQLQQATGQQVLASCGQGGVQPQPQLLSQPAAGSSTAGSKQVDDFKVGCGADKEMTFGGRSDICVNAAGRLAAWVAGSWQQQAQASQA